MHGTLRVATPDFSTLTTAQCAVAALKAPPHSPSPSGHPDSERPLLATDRPVAEPEPAALWHKEIADLPSCQTVYSSGDYRVVIALRDQAPHLLNEIGRLRELSFRAVGEGTGRERDLDAFDDWYTHLFVYNTKSAQVLGAYRLCMTDVVHRRLGPNGLYTRSLFSYDDAFLEQLGPALELGRSFVRPEFQGAGRVLALLWRGIAHLVAARPRYRTLFGPVSVSASYSEDARRLIATRLSQGSHRHALADNVKALRPVAPAVAAADATDEEVRALSKRIAELDGKKLPVLVTEYAKLGGKFLSFSVDPDFNDAMDGLVAVDLDQTNPKLLSIYMGSANYTKFCRLRSSYRQCSRSIETPMAV